MVKLEDGIVIQIVRKPGTRNEKLIKAPEGTKPEGRISNTTQVSKKLILQPRHKRMVAVTDNRCECVAATPLNHPYEKNLIVAVNGIVEVTPNDPFKILTATYGSKPYRLLKGKIVGKLTPHAGIVIPTEVILCEMLGIEENMDVKDRTNNFSRGRWEASKTTDSTTDMAATWEDKNSDPLE